MRLAAQFEIGSWDEQPFDEGGTFGGKSGSLVLQHVGGYADGAATAELTVLSGTGDLADAAGTGDFRADPAGSITLDLD